MCTCLLRQKIEWESWSEKFLLEEKGCEKLAVGVGSIVKVDELPMQDEHDNAENPKRKSKIAWNWLISKYVPHTASSLLQIRNEFFNSKLDSVEKDSDDQ